jgi:hypothetical protein
MMNLLLIRNSKGLLFEASRLKLWSQPSACSLSSLAELSEIEASPHPHPPLPITVPDTYGELTV